MKIFVSGMGGVAMGPLAMIARDMGHEVVGSNDVETNLSRHMSDSGFEVKIGQDEGYINQTHDESPIDWFVYTAALPDSHPELSFARENGIHTSKRDGFINELLDERGLKMLAVAGTHGKTNTTGMIIWCLEQANIPISYSVGSRMSFGEFGKYSEHSEYFIYEADEFDRNMLKFEPSLSIVTNIDFDHPDTYSSQADYNEAFYQFIDRSLITYMYRVDADKIELNNAPGVHLIDKDENESSTSIPGLYIRQNARLVIEVLTNNFGMSFDEAAGYINDYPGTERRMEKLVKNLYTDYAHHPNEIRSAIQQAHEINNDVVVIYQPHQNIRQHKIADQYKDCFDLASKIYWLPTYLSREADSELTILAQEELISKIDNHGVATSAELSDDLSDLIKQHLDEGKLVLCLSAGDLDGWLREQFD